MTSDWTEKTRIRYGDDLIPVRLPSDCELTVVGRAPSQGPVDPDILYNAIAEPLGMPVLSEFLQGAKSPLLIVNDGTRSTPTAEVLDQIAPDLAATPGWKVIIATGLHRAPSEAELRSIFGRRLDSIRHRILVHNGYDPESFRVIEGRDGPIELNRAIFESDRLIPVNSVEPHFFAGYTGGRKSIIPGLSGLSTVERSHAGAMEITAAQLRVAGNPVREFIHRNTRFLDSARVFSIQTVLDRDNRIAAAFAGDIDKTFDAACVAARNLYVIAIERRYDIVIAAVYPPLDMSLYQAHKGWELTQPGVRDGGSMILTAPCREKIGSSFYVKRVAENPDPARWPSLEGQPYVMGLHKLVRKARARARFHLMAVTGIPYDEVARYGYEPHDSLDSALHKAVARAGERPRVLVVEDAALVTLELNPH